jgi:hypothetical protein
MERKKYLGLFYKMITRQVIDMEVLAYFPSQINFSLNGQQTSNKE